MPHIAIAILAAGFSSRMGRPKQLLTYKSKTLLQHTIAAAVGTSCRPVIVVVQDLNHSGDYGDLENSTYKTVLNDHAKEGLSSSIALATGEVASDSTIDALLFLNCDQPRIDSASLEQLVSSYQPGCIVASKYDDTTGSPAIFDRDFFPKLRLLQGDRGAKSIMQCNKACLIEVAMESARFDIDTQDDYAALLD